MFAQYAVSETTLEQIFLHFARQTDESHYSRTAGSGVTDLGGAGLDSFRDENVGTAAVTPAQSVIVFSLSETE